MSSPIPAGYESILNALVKWGKSGLIPNTGVVKSYHPASIDNITGVAIPAPATIYKTGEIDDPLKANFRSIDELPNAPYSGSNVSDFNVNDIPTGPDTNLAHNAPVYGKFYKDSALTAEDEEEYKKNTSHLEIPTIVNRTTRYIDTTMPGIKVPKIVDELEDAKSFYSIAPLFQEVKDREEKTPLDTRKPIPKRYELIPTRIPCAIPGVLNCYLEVYDSIDVSQPEYTYTKPVMDMYYVSGTDQASDGSIYDKGDMLKELPIDIQLLDNPPWGYVDSDILLGDS